MIHPAIISFRKELHQFPELSGSECDTSHRIRKFVEKNEPTNIIENIGGNGIAVIYEFPNAGKTIVIRCEQDALPIEELNEFIHKSKINGVSHKCGHDGHMAIVAGLSFWIKEQKFTSGKIVLLFQPAEEIGTGASQVVNDARFINLKADHVFALHNIPQEPLHKIITINKGFSAEVQSFKIDLKGKESHASEPEHGINPANAISDLISEFSKLSLNDPLQETFAVLTPVYINMGQKSYGISPAKGELHYTVRTWDSEKMSLLRSTIESILNKTSKLHKLKHQIEWFEYFPASINDFESNQLVLKAAKENGFEIFERPFPFKFGEDFGWYSKYYKSAMFGIGAGMQTPALHNSDYDFPDAIIETGMEMFKTIIKNVLNGKT